MAIRGRLPTSIGSAGNSSPRALPAGIGVRVFGEGGQPTAFWSRGQIAWSSDTTSIQGSLQAGAFRPPAPDTNNRMATVDRLRGGFLAAPMKWSRQCTMLRLAQRGIRRWCMYESEAVAYLTSCYPRASDTFIRDEIQSLRNQGVKITSFAIRRPDPVQLVSDQLRNESQSNRLPAWRRTGSADLDGRNTVPPPAPARFLRAAFRMFTSHPPGFGNRVRQVAYLVEAAGLARHLRSGDPACP